MKQFFIAMMACLLSVLMMRADEVKVLEIELTEAGTLAQKLEEHNITDVDSLVIKGPMDMDDCRTLTNATAKYNFFYNYPDDEGIDEDYYDFEKKYMSLNLREVSFPNDSLSDFSFYIPEEDSHLSLVANYLELPTTLKHIGEKSFYFCSVQHFPKTLPSSVQLSPYAFYWSRYIDLDSFLPEGLSEVPDYCFSFAGISGNLTTPSTLKRIGKRAFEGAQLSRISSITLNEGLLEIGDYAFLAGSEDFDVSSPTIVIPSTCLTLGTGSFRAVNTAEISLPEGLREIPAQCFMSTLFVTRLNFPTSLRVIGDDAFNYSLWSSGDFRIKYLEIPEGVHYIGREAFAHAGFETFKFPSTTKTVGCGCLKDAVSGDIFIAASTPPECLPNNRDSSEPIFHGLQYNTLYVPVGAAEAYRQAYGWSEFTDIREDPNLKDSSVTEVWNGQDDAPLYDLSGRKVAHPQPGQICICRGRKVICK